VVVASCLPSGAQNSEVVVKLLENLYTTDPDRC